MSNVNKYIQKDREDKQKEDDIIVPLSHTAQEQTSEVERILVQSIIRHGDEIIYEGLEDEDGNIVNLNVAQYIDFDLGEDGITFANPLYNRILREAVAHSADAGFKADRYFMQHPDPEISQLAAALGIDRHQLSKSFQKELSMSQRRQQVIHLILDYRMVIVQARLKEIQRQLKEVGSDMEKMKALMSDFRQTQELRDALARQLGFDVIVS